MRFFSQILLLLIGLFLSLKSEAQLLNSEGKIILGGRIEGSDTIPHSFLPTIHIVNPDLIGMTKGQLRRYKKRRKRYARRMNRLRKSVYKTYPYAVMASYLVKDIDSAMLVIRSKDAKSAFKSRKEKELMKEYKNDLENMTMSQGKVLVILIARETGKDCYSIIKDLKGGFNARIWQTLAVLFSNNLKRQYDPQGEDLAIEQIVREIEASGKFIRVNN